MRFVIGYSVCTGGNV